MQDLLTYAIDFVVVGFAALMVVDFVTGLLPPVQHQKVEPVAEAATETIEQPEPGIEQLQQPLVATQDWVRVVDESEEVKSVNVIELAKVRQLEIELQPQLTKRKTGRPKKNTTPAPTTSTVKRKPGRPRKAA